MQLTIEQALKQASAAQKAGKIDEAVSLWQAILRSDSRHPIANHNLGVFNVSKNKISDALPRLKIAVERAPQEVQFWVSYIGALIEDGQRATAKKIAKQATDLGIEEDLLGLMRQQMNSAGLGTEAPSAVPSPEKIKSLQTHYQNGRLADAEQLAIAMTEKFPEHPFAWTVLGAVLYLTDRPAEAVYPHQVSVALSPDNAQAHSNLGQILNKLGRLDEAEESCRKALSLNPRAAIVHNNLGAILHKLGRLKEAEASYRMAVELKTDFAEAHTNLGVTLKELGKLKEAEQSHAKAASIKNGN